MKIIIDKSYNESFVKVFLVKYIHDKILDLYNPNKVLRINNEFKINSKKVFEVAANNLIVNETPTYYKVSINRNVRVDSNNLVSLLNLITYGSRTCKGYTLIIDIFNFIKDNLDVLYKEWLDGD